MRYKITLEYDGTGFVGWQRQKSGVSVAQVLEEAIQTCTRQKVVVYGSGRTDTGVHAMGQVAHFDLEHFIDPFRLQGAINALVRPHLVCVKACETVSDDFHARFSAKRRSYLYKIQNTVYPPVLNQNKVCHFAAPLDANAMDKAAQILVGRHDFSTFRASECQAKSPVKTLDEIHVWREGEMVYMKVAAKSFLHHQVRNFAGSLMLVGGGKWTAADLRTAFEACDRTKGGPTASPGGLYFMEAVY